MEDKVYGNKDDDVSDLQILITQPLLLYFLHESS